MIIRFPFLAAVFCLSTALGVRADDGPVPKEAVRDLTVKGGSGGGQGSADNFLFTGSFLNSVPIEVPPGTAGMEPDLAFQYNSSAGNGWLGVGWDLSAGSIQRSTKKGVPSYDNAADTFVITLQGQSQELVKIADGTYRAKIEAPFQKFVFDTTANKWMVYDKNGSIYIFGQTPESRLDRDATSTFLWALDRVQDRNGNYMTLAYDKPDTNQQIYLKEMRYSGHPGDASNSPTDASRLVKFTLQTQVRADILTTYLSGFKISTRRRLDRVETLVKIGTEWKPAARYDLVYNTRAQTGRSLLQTINLTKYQADQSITVRLARFDYPADVQGWSESVAFAPPHTMSSGPDMWIPTMGGFVDFDANGLPDFEVAYQGERKSYLNGGQGFSQSSAWTLPVDQAVNVDFNNNGTAFADLDGDGKLDFVFAHQTLPRQAWLNTPGGWQENVALTPPGDLVTQAGKLMGAQFVDLNADRKADYIASYYVNGTETRLTYLNTGSGWSLASQWNLPSGLNLAQGTEWHDTGAQFVDLNGDGYLDCVYAFNNARMTAINTHNGWRLETNWTLPDNLTVVLENCPVNTNPGTRFVDVNGDGLPDFVISRAIAGGLNTYLNTGRGWEQDTEWNLPQWLAVLYKTQKGWWQTGTAFTDLNGDGLVDFLYAYTDTAFNSHIKVAYLNTGSGWVESSAWLPPDWMGVTGGLNTGSRLIDVNGDQLSDFTVSSNAPDRLYAHTWLSNAPRHGDLISGITNQMGGTTSVTYERSSVYPNTFLPFNMWVVKSIVQDDGIATTENMSTSYEYKKGLFELEEKEFLGFGEVTATNARGDQTVTTFLQDKTPTGAKAPKNAYKGKASEVKIISAAAGLMRTQKTLWEMVNPSSGVYFVRAQSVTSELNDAGSLATRQSFVYDDAAGSVGNIIKTINDGDINATTDQRYDEIDYASDSSSYLKAFPKETRSYDTNSTLVSKTRFYYDGATTLGTISRGNVTRVEKCSNLTAGTYIGTTSTYDRFGHVLSVTDPANNTTRTTYDAFGFPSTVTSPPTIANPEGHVVSSTYDPLTGNVKTDTDPNNQTTTYLYDPLGRMVKTFGPLDTEASPTVWVDYHQNVQGTPGAQHVETFRRERHGEAAELWGKTYFDGFGRTFKSEAKEANGDFSVVETIFNNVGQAAQTSVPRLFSSTAKTLWSEKTTDALGRTIDLKNPDGKHTTTRYTGFRTEVTDANNVTQVSVTDAYGQVVRRLEPPASAETAYQYDSLGRLTKMIDSQTKQTTFAYDPLGRKTAMTDPNAGTWSYTYDSRGNLLEQTDPRQVRLGLQYDNLSRLLQKKLLADPGAATGQAINTVLASYAYDESGAHSFGKGRLTSLVDESGSASFFHDAVGQVIREEKSVDGQSHNVSSSYDAMGRLTRLQYPNSHAVRYSYNDGGQLSRVTDDTGSVLYASLPKYDGQGRATEITQGNGIKTAYTFSDSQTLASLTIKNTAEQRLKQWTYNYDNVNNMTDITDQLDSTQSQHFEYDPLRRLKLARGTYGEQTYSYDKLGNFIKKADVDYSYDVSTRPYAVSRTQSASMPGRDSSTVLAWNLDPSESIYRLGGLVTNTAGQALSNVPVVLSGLYDQAVNSSTSAVATEKGRFEFRGIPGGANSFYTVYPASSGFVSSPLSYSASPLGADNLVMNFQMTATTSVINFTTLQTPRRAVTGGIPAPRIANGTFTAGYVVGGSLGGTAAIDGVWKHTSGYSPLPDPVGGTQPPTQYILPPAAVAGGVMGPAFVTGLYQQALSFNGQTDIFVFPGSTSYAGNQLTTMILVKPTAHPSSGYATLITKSTGAALGALGDEFRVAVSTLGRVVFEIGKTGGSSAMVTSNSALMVGVWSFVAATYDGATLKVFINGTEAGSLNYNGGVVRTSRPTSIAGSLSTLNRPYNGTFFSGVLDEPRLNNRAWTAQEIRNAYTAFTSAVCSYNYDAAGNMISKITPVKTTSYRYDAQGRLNRVQENGVDKATYVYDADGGRVKKIGTGTTIFIGKLFEKRPDGSAINRIYAGSQLVCERVVSSTGAVQLYYPQTDHLGSTVLVTDPNGTPIQTMTYQPFGQIQAATGASPITMKYTGQEDDSDIGLYYYNARYYDSVLGRFISPDSIVTNANNPQDLNRYVYVSNNPINRIDPSGHSSGNFFKKNHDTVNVVGTVCAVATYAMSASGVGVGFYYAPDSNGHYTLYVYGFSNGGGGAIALQSHDGKVSGYGQTIGNFGERSDKAPTDRNPELQNQQVRSNSASANSNSPTRELEIEVVMDEEETSLSSYDYYALAEFSSNVSFSLNVAGVTSVAVGGPAGFVVSESLGGVATGFDLVAAGGYYMDYRTRGNRPSLNRFGVALAGVALDISTSNLGSVGVKQASYGSAFYSKTTGYYSNRSIGRVLGGSDAWKSIVIDWYSDFFQK